jgi:hypothetical protein
LFVVLGKLGLDLLTIWDVTCLLIKENWDFFVFVFSVCFFIRDVDFVLLIEEKRLFWSSLALG